jgi:hypothetical protein
MLRLYEAFGPRQRVTGSGRSATIEAEREPLDSRRSQFDPLQSIDSAAKLTLAGGEADVQLRSSDARACCYIHIPNRTAFAPDLLAEAAFIPIRSSITSVDMQQKSLTQLHFQGGPA